MLLRHSVSYPLGLKDETEPLKIDGGVLRAPTDPAKGGHIARMCVYFLREGTPPSGWEVRQNALS